MVPLSCPKSFVFEIFPSSLKLERFRKAYFHDGLVWTVGLTVEIEQCLQNYPTYRGFKLCLELPYWMWYCAFTGNDVIEYDGTLYKLFSS